MEKGASADVCEACPAFTVASQFASTSCTTCPAGTYLRSNTLDASTDPQRQCWPCPAGSFSGANSTYCTVCSPPSAIPAF